MSWRDQSCSPPEWLLGYISQPVSRSLPTLLREKVQNLKNIIFNLFRSRNISRDCSVIKTRVVWVNTNRILLSSGLAPFNFNIICSQALFTKVEEERGMKKSFYILYLIFYQNFSGHQWSRPTPGSPRSPCYRGPRTQRFSASTPHHWRQLRPLCNVFKLSI